jgi:hypothetical protein
MNQIYTPLKTENLYREQGRYCFTEMLNDSKQSEKKTSNLINWRLQKILKCYFDGIKFLASRQKALKTPAEG